MAIRINFCLACHVVDATYGGSGGGNFVCFTVDRGPLKPPPFIKQAHPVQQQSDRRTVPQTVKPHKLIPALSRK